MVSRGKCSSPVCLTIRLVRAYYGLSVKGLRIVMVVSCQVMDKNIQTPSKVGIWTDGRFYNIFFKIHCVGNAVCVMVNTSYLNTNSDIFTLMDPYGYYQNMKYT